MVIMNRKFISAFLFKVKRFVARFKVLSIEEASELNLTIKNNLYGDAINIYGCRSIWEDEKGREYCVSHLVPNTKFDVYQCNKVVCAAKIDSVNDDFTLSIWAKKRLFKINVSEEWIKRHKPKTGGYYVIYEDDYTSYSPKEAFESGYHLISK